MHGTVEFALWARSRPIGVPSGTRNLCRIAGGLAHDFDLHRTRLFILWFYAVTYYRGSIAGAKNKSVDLLGINMKNTKSMKSRLHRCAVPTLVRLIVAPLSAVVLLTGGCDGSSGDGSDGSLDVRIVNPEEVSGGPFTHFAYFDLISDDLEDHVNYGANFLQMVESQPASVFALSVPPAIDKCNLRITEAIPTDASAIGFPEAQFNLVSAGETYTLNGTAGEYASIVRADSRFEVAPYPIPEPLTLDIPGDVFPALTGISVPNTPLVTNFAPNTNAEVAAETPITWTPSGVPGHSVFMHIFAFPASERVVDLRCRMADDGSFSLGDSPEVVEALNDSLGAGFTLTGLTLEHRAFTVVSQGDTLIVVGKKHLSL